MIKIVTAIVLFILFVLYSFLVYTRGTENDIVLTGDEAATVEQGKQLYQNYNCQSCHQIYGLGGYLGPDLTTAFSDSHRGPAYMRALLQSGGNRMPDFHFSQKEIDHLISYLKYVDSTATPVKPGNRK